MKKLINILLIVLCITFFGCSKKGEIHTEPHDFIEINGKVYKLMSVVPCNNCNSIWIMYPKDSTEQMPQSINYNVREGKHDVNHTVIIVK
jgi:hypothetical protein